MRLRISMLLLLASQPVFVSAGAFDRIYNVKDPPYNAAGDGITDDRFAIQAALNDAGCYTALGNQTNGGVVYFPPGTYKLGKTTIAGTLTINNPCTILGAGTLTSTIRYAYATGDAFNIQLLVANVGDWRPLIFRDITLEANPGATSTGSAIRYSSNNWANGLRVENVRFGYGMTYNLRLETAAAFVVTDCHFQGARWAEIYLDNQSNIDAGDGMIANSWFYSVEPPLPDPRVFAAIWHKGGGGLKVLGNKFIGYQYHYYNDVSTSAAPSHSTSIFHFSNNSSEGPTYGNVWFNVTADVGALYEAIIIEGNDFSVCGLNLPPGTNCDGSNPQGAVVVTQAPNAHGMTKFGLISDNIVRVNGGRTSNGINFYQSPGAFLGDVSDWFVSGNLFHNLELGIYVSASVSRFHVGENRYNNVTTRLVNGSSTSGNYVMLLNSPPPAETLTGQGGQLYVEAGSLKYKGSYGTVTVLAVP